MIDDNAQRFPIALFDAYDDNVPKIKNVTWRDVVAAMFDFVETPCTCEPDDSENPSKTCPHKMGPAWSPVEFKPGTERRLDVNVQAITFAVYDLDHLTTEGLHDVARKLDGLACVIHSTHSHRPPHDQALRAVVQLSRPVPAADWRRFLATSVEHLGIPADRTCKNLSRIYFLPTVQQGQERLVVEETGRPLDVDMILAKAPATTYVPAIAINLPADTVVESVSVDLGELIKAIRLLGGSYKRKCDTEHARLCTAILAGEMLAEPGKGQANALHVASCMLATKFPAGTPSGAALEIMRRSIVAMGAGPEGLDYWFERATYSYDRAMEGRIARDAEAQRINNDLRARMKHIRPPGPTTALDRSVTANPATQGHPGELSVELPPREDADPESDDEGEYVAEEWHKLLIFKPIKDPNETPRIASNEHNAGILLTYDEEWVGVIRFNEVSKTIEVHGGPLPKSDTHISTLPRAVADYLLVTYGISLGEQSVKSVLLLVARRNAYDPLRTYLLGVTWDGQPRIAGYLVDYCNVVTRDANGIDITSHVRTISQKWLVSCVARGLEPGCKVDTVLVLEGLMGLKKSGVFDVLAGPFYAASSINLADKESKQITATRWIVELAELNSIRKSERESTNAHLTMRVDYFRPPYGVAPEEFPRRAVFVGTTEDDDWLSSDKGIRRFWPVRIGSKIQKTRIERDRDQLWAEAVAVYRAAESCADCLAHDDKRCNSHSWWLDDEQETQARELANERVRENEVVDIVSSWWFSLPTPRPVAVRIADIARDAMQLTTDKIAMSESLRKGIGEAMKALGFKRVRRGPAKARTYVYESTEELRSAPQMKVGVTGAAMRVAMSNPHRGAP